MRTDRKIHGLLKALDLRDCKCVDSCLHEVFPNCGTGCTGHLIKWDQAVKCFQVSSTELLGEGGLSKEKGTMTGTAVRWCLASL